MSRFESAPDHEHGNRESLGVLLVNLGTPDEPTPAAVRRYLRQFLSDPRVVELPRPLWWLILNGVILRIRPSRSARAYRKIWTDEGSPLLTISRAIASGLQDRLAASMGGAAHVELGMSYGRPSISDALDRLHAAEVRRLLVLPLYPQYSGTTTGSVFDAATACLRRRRWVPEFRFINHYHDDPAYIASLAASVRDYWDLNGRGDKLLMSFHGTPRTTLLSGDPYHCHCQKTGRLLAAALDLGDAEWMLSFQSRVGRAEWLRPYTDETVVELGRSGVRDLDVLCPGFAADCLETLEEIVMQNGELFVGAGGRELRYIPALNARDDHIAMLAGLVKRHAAGWPELPLAGEGAAETEDPAATRTRALGMGASR